MKNDWTESQEAEGDAHLLTQTALIIEWVPLAQKLITLSYENRPTTKTYHKQWSNTKEHTEKKQHSEPHSPDGVCERHDCVAHKL